MKHTIIGIAITLLPMLGIAQESTDLSLQDAIGKALENNYGIIIQQKNVEVVDTQNTWGAAGALPNVSFSGSASNSWNYSEDDFTTLGVNGTVSLNWTVFRGFSARITKEKLDELSNLSEGTLNIVVENTLSSVINTYYQALLGLENIRIAEEVASLSEDRYNVEMEKKEIGSSTTYDLLQAKNAYLEDQSNLLSAKNNYKLAIRQLNYLMGGDLDAEYILTDGFQHIDETYELEDLEARMLSNNYTLQSQYLNLKMAELEVRSAKSSYYPTLSVGVSGGYNSSETAYETYVAGNSDLAAFNTQLSASLSYTIYNGGVRKQTLKVAEMNQEISDIETEQMELEMKMTLRQELDYYVLRLEQLDLASENLEAAKLNLQLSKDRYNNGTISSFNFRDVQQMYMSIALQYENALYNLQESYNSLLKLTGGLVDVY